MDKCPKCGLVMCDAPLYYRVKGKKGHIMIKCPNCGYVFDLTKQRRQKV